MVQKSKPRLWYKNWIKRDIAIAVLDIPTYPQIGRSLNWYNSIFVYFYFLGEEGEDNCDYVAVFLTSRLQGDLDVKYDFSVLKSDNTCWGRIGNTFKKFCPDQNSWGYGKAFSKAKLMEKQNELLPNGCLTIVCNLEIFYSDKTTQGRVSERMSYEDSSIFFHKSCTYSPFDTK